LFAQATLFPNQGIALLFIGVIPLRWLAIGFLVLDVLLGIDGNVSLSAHWGGALTGFLVARLESRGRDLSAWAKIFFRRRHRRKQRSGRSASFLDKFERSLAQKRAEKTYSIKKTASRVDEREIDRILDKISAYGYDALTEEEKRILNEASRDW